MRISFYMDCNEISTCFSKILYIAIWLFNHQMNIKRKIRYFSDCFNNQRTH